MTHTSLTLDESSKQAIHIASSLAKENMHSEYSGPHLLLALLHNEVGLAALLATNGFDVNYLKDWGEYKLESYPKGISKGSVSQSVSVDSALEVADMIRLKLREDTIGPLALLIAIIRPGIVFSTDELKTLPVTEQQLLKMTLQDDENGHGNQNRITSSKSSAVGDTISQTALSAYTTDKTARAKDGLLDPVIGRDKEIRMLIEILGRRTKPNVIIIGEPGVGKSALVEGFAQEIVLNRVPEHLCKASIFELDLGSLIAGASYKGEIEDRLKKVLAAIQGHDNAILFIDEIHALLDPAGSFGQAANLLKPVLARGELTVIGATTVGEHRKFIEQDDAFNRRFDLLQVDEPDYDTCYEILKKILPLYQEHHGLTMEDAACHECIQLAKRYLKERRLPDSAIDLMDQTMAAVKMLNESTQSVIDDVRSKLDELLNNDSIESDQKTRQLKWIARELENRFSPILLGQLAQRPDVQNLEGNTIIDTSLRSYLTDVQNAYSKQQGSEVGKNDIAALVAQKTGIPIGKLQSDEQEKILHLEEILKKRVVGQDHALHIVAEAVRESRAGLLKPGQPIASFFFLGPTGTGKTELAKALAEFLFNDEQTLLRFDMSEFKEEHSVALLYGAPPGYVGYQEGGVLINKIRRQPYSVVLFDEIEKAHTSVFDLFLQILDEGKLHDRLGKVGDFSNSIILFTSNIASDIISKAFNAGKVPNQTELMETMSRYFRPEFLARLTEIVPFSPIQEEIVLSIFNIQLSHLIKTLDSLGIKLDISDAAKRHVAMQGFDQKYGARQLKGVIRNVIRRPLSRMIISGEVKRGDMVKISLDKEKNLIWKSENS